MKIECPSCGGKGTIDDAMIPDQGTNVRCPSCREKFFVQKEKPVMSAPSQSFAPLAPGPAASAASQPGASPFGETAQAVQQECSVCKNRFPQSNMIRFDTDTWVCPACKPVYLQMVQQGVHVGEAMRYGGFWIRFCAKFLDGLITLIASYLLTLPFHTGANAGIVGPMFSILINIAVPLTYSVYFVGKFRATPGKMACGLMIVMADGGRVSYMRALGRYCAEILSSIILLIGYIMAAFDSEKRALHDRICDTRVIRK